MSFGLLTDILGVWPASLEDTLGTVTEIIRGTTASCTSSEGSAGPQLPPDEMVDYVIDTAATLHSYILAHPGSAGAFLRQDMLGHTVRLYSAVVPWLDGTVTNGTPRLVADGIKSAARVSVKAVERCRRWLSLLAHELLLKCYADLGTDSGERDEQVASVLDLLDSILAEDGGLATDLAVSRPVIETLQKIAAAVAAGKLTGIDLTRLDYITTVFVQLTSEGDVAAAEHAASIAAAAATSAAAALPGAGMAASTTAGVAAAWPEITQVQDMLPGLGDGFVVACLEHFGNRPDLVINSILEETLPQKLASMPRDAPRTLAVAPSVSLSPARSKAGPVGGLLGDFLKDRHNIFDGDEFDVFSNREVDTRRIQKGKGAAPDAKAILNDKTAVKSRLQLYLETQYDSQDDEYDDTYDDAPMPSREIGIEGQPPLEPNPNRKVVNILSPGDNDGGDAATGHESSGSATTGGLARQEPAARQFTTGSLGSEGTTSVGQGRSGSTRTRKAHGDPEEPRWRTPDARPGGRGGGGGGGGGRRGGAAANVLFYILPAIYLVQQRWSFFFNQHLCVCLQEAKKKPAVDLSKRNEASLRIRDKNEKNKAARANHNRKKGADKKARAGMLGP